MQIWEILNEGKLGRWEGFWERDKPRLYLSREKAEAKALLLIEKIHKDHITYMRDIVTDEGERECFDEDEIKWWLDGPEFTITQTKDQTFYGVGDPEWDSRDRRGAGYGWIKSREVVE